MKKISDASARLLTYPAYFLFFLMLAFPMAISLLYVKASLFALLLLFVLVRSVTRLHLHAKVVTWALALALVSLFFALRGMLLGTPGAISCFQVYVMWPLIYTFLLNGVNNLRVLQGLNGTLVFSTAFIGVFGMLYVLSALNIIPRIPNLDSFLLTDEIGAGFYDGHVALRFPGLNSLPFLVPFLMAAVVCWWSQPHVKVLSKLWPSMALLLVLPVVIFSGRRALQLVTILAPLLIMIFGSFQPRKERLFLRGALRRVTVSLILLVALSVPLLRPVYAITFEGLTERFSAGFDFSISNMSDSSEARREQYSALTRGWTESPLIGACFGASAHDSIRSETMPWAYELYYLALLFQTGILGFAAYAAGILWIYWSGIRIIRLGGGGSQFMVPILVGMTGLLIANGTNPYLVRFDGIWVIFFPLGYINHWLLERDQVRKAPIEGIRKRCEQP